MPAKEGLRRDHERGPTVAGQRPARRGEERPIVVFELGAAHRAAKNSYLVAKNGVLELELRHTPTCSEIGRRGERATSRRRIARCEGCYRPVSIKRGTEFWSPTGVHGSRRSFWPSVSAPCWSGPGGSLGSSGQTSSHCSRSRRLPHRASSPRTCSGACPSRCVVYVSYRGVVGRPFVGTVRLTQTGRMQPNAGQPWFPLHAEEHYSVRPPGFVWD
jgi:Family of unknown function (DUF6544)